MKQALLILQEASSKELEMSKPEVETALSRKFPDMTFKSFSYQNDHPEEVTYHLGQLVKFLARNNGQIPEQPEQLTEEELTFRQQMGQFWQMAKPELKKLLREVWYSKDQLRKIEEGKKPDSRISTSSVKLKGREDGKENNQA